MRAPAASHEGPVPPARERLPADLDMRQVGVGWRQPHYRDVLEHRPTLGFLEVHSENFFARGGAGRATLLRARDHYPVSLHGVGLGLGSALGIDGGHLDQLASLVNEVDPVRVSDHACFGRARLPGSGALVHGADLLPIAFNDAQLHTMAAHVEQVQERLRRPLLIENLSAYLDRRGHTMSEAEFFNRLCRRTGCQMLLDLNNVLVNALNARRLAGGAQRDAVAAACAFVQALDAAIVGEIHVAGCSPTRAGDIVVDDHGAPVSDACWEVYRRALAHCAPRLVPTLVEWDSRLPAWSVLYAQAVQAAQWQMPAHRVAMAPLHPSDPAPAVMEAQG